MAIEKLFDQKAIDLLEKPIPKFEIIHPSMISVLRAHSELNLSNLLAYFFIGDFSNHLKEVFLNSLIDCINLDPEDDRFLNDITDKGFGDIEIIKEYQTNSGGIDILIIDHSERNSERRAIIIENKLYHDVNNDFDDYFYSVCNDFNIEPKNIAVVVLSLKKFHSKTHSNMKSANVLHSGLKVAVVEELGKDLNLLYDKTSGLLVGEYIKHIDDLYLDSSSYGNEKCYEYYAEHRQTINKIITGAKRLFKEDFSTISEPNKKFLFEHRTKLEELIELHKDICNSANDYFIHYTKITDRNVQGKDYFRGRGLSYDVIRYKLDFQSHFINDSPIDFVVYLNDKELQEHNIDLSSPEIEEILKKLNISKSIKPIKNNWFEIYKENLEIDKTILNSILKDKIDKQWGELEDVLIVKIKDSLIDKFNQIAIAFLKDKGLEYEIKDEIVRFIAFSNSTTDMFVRYSLKFSPPDLIEIILYVNNSSWDSISDEIKTDRGFIHFSEKQSYRIPELKSDFMVGEPHNYDALLKKSFRIKSLEELTPFLELEREKWIEKEKEIMNIIEKDLPKIDLKNLLEE